MNIFLNKNITMFYVMFCFILGVISTTGHKLDREIQSEHILEVRNFNQYSNN